MPGLLVARLHRRSRPPARSLALVALLLGTPTAAHAAGPSVAVQGGTHRSTGTFSARAGWSLGVVVAVPLGAASRSVTEPAGARPATTGSPPGGWPRIVLRRALEHAGLAFDGRLDAMSRRARWSAALPEVTLRGGRTTDETLRLTPTSEEPFRYTQGGSATLVLEGRVRWQLDRLAFASEEIQIERLRAERRKARAELVREVVGELVKWGRARRALADDSLDDERRSAAELALLEAELRLDALTGGWFATSPFAALGFDRSR